MKEDGKTVALSRDECWIDHQPNEVCEVCGLLVDDHGNTEDDFRFCAYPDCGCDGSRLCMAPSGASDRACSYNVEGMYRQKDPAPRLRAMGDILRDKTDT